MVGGTTQLGRSGLSAWLIQRVSAVILGAYALFLILFLVCHPAINHALWSGLFSHPWMKISTLLVVLNLLAHAWIGLWTVITDYIHCSCLRLILEVGLVLGLLAYFLWALMIVWS